MLLTICCDVFRFALKEQWIKISIDPRKLGLPHNAKTWSSKVHKNVMRNLYILFEVFGLCSQEQFKANKFKLPHREEEMYETSLIYLIKAPCLDKEQGIWPCVNLFKLKIKKPFGRDALKLCIETFNREGWFDKLCGEINETKKALRPEAVEHFKEVRGRLYKQVPELPPAWAYMLERLNFHFKQQHEYMRRCEEINLTDYQFLMKVKHFIEMVKSEKSPKKRVLVQPYEAPFMTFEHGNKSLGDPKKFIDYIHNFTTPGARVLNETHEHFTFKCPGETAELSKKDKDAEKDYAYEAGDIMVLERECDEQLKHWNPETFDLPEYIMKSWSAYEPYENPFYEQNDFFIELSRDLNLIQLLELRVDGDWEVIQRNEDQSEKGKIINSIYTLFNSIWEEDSEHLEYDNRHYIKEIILRAYIMRL